MPIGPGPPGPPSSFPNLRWALAPALGATALMVLAGLLPLGGATHSTAAIPMPIGPYGHAIDRTGALSALGLPADAGFEAPVGSVTVASILGSRAPAGGLAPPPPLAARHGALPVGPPLSLASPSPAVSSPAASNQSMRLQYVHDGLDFNSAGGTTPPDVQMAVGPAQVVEFVNVYGEVFNLTGVSRTSFFLGSFFGTGSDYLSDPKILYDNESSRWFASILHFDSASGNYDNRLAVSVGPNALGTWHVYALTDSPAGSLGDQPILGVSSKLISISVNLFTSTNAGVEFWIVNKSSAMSGGPIAFQMVGPMFARADSSIHPVQGVSPNDSLFLVEVGPSSTQLRLLEVSGVPPAAISFSNASLTISSISPAPSAAQPGTSQLIDTGDPRVQTAVWNAGSLWLAFNDQCRPSGDTVNRACFRMVELNTSTVSVAQEFDVGAAGAYLYYPALALNGRGDLTLVYGESSPSIYASVLVSGRLASDPAHSLRPAATLRAGTADLTVGCSGSVCRYGDYFGAGESPGNSTAWVAGEWNGAASYWSTAFGMASSPSPPVLQAKLTASALELDAGQSTTLSFRLLNSTCVNTTGDHCDVSLPLPVSPYSASCVSPFAAINRTITLSQPGTYSLGRGGFVAVYASATCAGTPYRNLTIAPVAVTVYARPSVGIVASSPFPVELHQSFTLTANVSNGAGTIRYLWSGLPQGCVNSFGPVQPCAPTGVGPVTITLNVTDRVGVSAATTLGFVVVPNPAVSVSSDVTSLDVGLPVDLAASADGGIGSLSFVWNGLPTGCPSANQADLRCLPTHAGTFAPSVTVNDSLGFRSSSANLSLLVYPAPVVSIGTSGSTPYHVGGTFTLTGTASGGAPPFTFSWSGLPPGCAAASGPFVDCTPTSSGRFTVQVDAADSVGGHATHELNLTVEAASPTGAGATSGLGTTTYLIVGLLLVAVVLAVLVLALRRRRNRS